MINYLLDKLDNLKGKTFELKSLETVQLSGNLGYNTCLCTISHNNITTSFVGILSGATDYYGIHSLAIHSTGDIVIENGIRGDGNLKIINKMSGSQLISLIPIGIDSLPLTLVR